MVTKSDALARKLPKHRSILLAHKIRTHPVPYNYDDVALEFRGYHRCSRRADDAKQQ
jgi:hypothetical protein